MSVLNTPKSTFNRNTPKHMHLGVFSSIKLADRILDEKYLRYVPLKEVDVSRFGIDFSNTVIFVSTYRDETRSWHAKSMLETAEYVKSLGLVSVFVGKTDMNEGTELKPKTSLPDNVDAYGVDLRNKTSIEELASICGKAKAVVGMDSGPIHLAGTTSVPIVCAFTSIFPEYRVPYREKGEFYPVTADIPCIGCESDWESHYWNFEKCYLKTIDCCNLLGSDKFIEQLKKILEGT
jgi:ADP-heptose:LPS heptosyltransferase